MSLICLAIVLAVLGLSTACARPAPASISRPGEGGLWQGAAIFDAVRALLASGGRGSHLWVEIYEFDRPDLEADLLQARARGVDVRLISDPTVDVSRQTVARLAGAGLAAHLYPVDDRSHQIDHVKLVWTDQAALVAGMNWGSKSAANHDYALMTRDTSEIQRLEQIFQYDWSLAAHLAHPGPSSLGTGQVAETAPGQEVRHLLAGRIGGTRISIEAEIYTLTDGEMLAALAAAHRRGVYVRMIVDPNQRANLHALEDLGQAGVAVRKFPVPKGALLHAKAALFDGGSLVAGSANWTRQGLSVNHELDLESASPAAARSFHAQFEQDWQASS